MKRILCIDRGIEYCYINGRLHRAYYLHPKQYFLIPIISVEDEIEADKKRIPLPFPSDIDPDEERDLIWANQSAVSDKNIVGFTTF